MLNHVMLIGRLTKDPEKTLTNGGHAVTTFTLAVDRPFKNAQGEREADFIRIVAWRKLGEVVALHMQKGRLVAVEGRLQTRSFENGEGQRVYMTEVVADNVVFLDRPKNTDSPAPQQPYAAPQQPYATPQQSHAAAQPTYAVPKQNQPQYEYADSNLPF